MRIMSVICSTSRIITFLRKSKTNDTLKGEAKKTAELFSFIHAPCTVKDRWNLWWNEGMTSVGVCLQCGVVGYLLEEEEERRHQDHLSVRDERLLSHGLHHRSCQLSDRAVVSRSVLCCHTNTVVRWLSALNTYSFSLWPPWRGSLFFCGFTQDCCKNHWPDVEGRREIFKWIPILAEALIMHDLQNE